MDGNGFILQAMDLKEQKMNRGQDTWVISCTAGDNQCSQDQAILDGMAGRPDAPSSRKTLKYPESEALPSNRSCLS